MSRIDTAKNLANPEIFVTVSGNKPQLTFDEFKKIDSQSFKTSLDVATLEEMKSMSPMIGLIDGTAGIQPQDFQKLAAYMEQTPDQSVSQVVVREMGPYLLNHYAALLQGVNLTPSVSANPAATTTVPPTDSSTTANTTVTPPPGGIVNNHTNGTVQIIQGPDGQYVPRITAPTPQPGATAPVNPQPGVVNNHANGTVQIIQGPDGQYVPRITAPVNPQPNTTTHLPSSTTQPDTTTHPPSSTTQPNTTTHPPSSTTQPDTTTQPPSNTTPTYTPPTGFQSTGVEGVWFHRTGDRVNLWTANGINTFYTDYTNGSAKPSIAYDGTNLLVETGDPNDKRKILARKSNTSGTTTKIIYDSNTTQRDFSGATGKPMGDPVIAPTTEEMKKLTVQNFNS